MMPQVCCVVGCRSGRKEGKKARKKREEAEQQAGEILTRERITLFRFPPDDERDRVLKWRRMIPRKLGDCLKNLRVCELHFDKRFVMKVSKTIEFPTGDRLTSASVFKRLTMDAVPTLFPTCPSYLSKKLPRVRTDPEQRKMAHLTPKFESYDDIDGGASKAMNDDVIYAAQVACSREPVARLEKSNTDDSILNGIAHHQQAPKFTYSRPITRCKRPRILITSSVAHQQLNWQVLGVGEATKPDMKFKSCQTSGGDRIKKLEGQVSELKAVRKELPCKVLTGRKEADVADKDFILDGLLIRCALGTAGYEFLRDQHGYPYPSMADLHKTSPGMIRDWGFDLRLFEELAANTATYKEKDKRGILIFGEMKMASEDVTAKSNVYNNLNENDVITSTVAPATDHALLFAFATFESKYKQVVGKFTSTGPTPAAVKCKLLLKCLLLVEGRGLRVEAVVSDGGEGVKACLAKFGVSGSKDYFENPWEERRVYSVVDDHLVKCIRNTVGTI